MLGGIGRNKLRVKLGTGFGKPGGIFRLTDQNWFEVLGGCRTDALWGIGRKTADRLDRYGITTVSELAAADPEAMAGELGPMTGPWLVRLARGQDESPVVGSPSVARSRSRRSRSSGTSTTGTRSAARSRPCRAASSSTWRSRNGRWCASS